MYKSIHVRQKKRGRPRTGHDPAVSIRLPLELISKLDDWARSNPSFSRSDAVRELIQFGLRKASRREDQTNLREQGFLSPSITEWIERHRLANASWFGLAEDLNDVAKRKKHTFFYFSPLTKTIYLLR